MGNETVMRPDGGDVRHPRSVGRLGREVAREQVRRDGAAVRRSDRGDEALLGPRNKPVFAHEARYALHVHGGVLGAELARDARTPVAPAVLLEYRRDVRQKLRVTTLASRLRLLEPAVVAALRMAAPSRTRARSKTSKCSSNQQRVLTTWPGR